MKKKLFASTCLLALFGCCLSGCSNSGGFSDNTFKIGCTGPLTGDAASYGIAVKNSAELAIKEINEAGGVNGFKFSFEMKDDQLQTNLAKNNFAFLYEKGMHMSLGGVTSSACLQFIEGANDKGIFTLCPSATNSDVTKKDNVYQMCFTDPNQGKLAAEYYQDNYSGKSVGVFYDSSDDYSLGIYQAFTNIVKGATVASFTSDTKNNFDSQVNALKNCEFIFLPIYYTQAALFIRTAKGIINDKAVYFGCDGLDGLDTFDPNFVPSSYPQKISYLSHFNPKGSATRVQNFVTNYKKAYGETTLNQFGASSYDCIYALYNAVKVAYNNNPDTVKPSMKPSDLNTLLKGIFTNGFTYSDGITGGGGDIAWNSDRTVNKQPTIYYVN